MTAPPAPADPEIAAATFALHLGEFFTSSPRCGAGWGRVDLGPLLSVVALPGLRDDGTQDPYFVTLDATWYDQHPPRLTFVEPVAGYPAARPGSRWWPRLEGSPPFPFALHSDYRFEDGLRPLVCFSHSFDYYISGHSPTAEQIWVQGRHTVTATLTRLSQVLRTTTFHYGPSCGA